MIEYASLVKDYVIATCVVECCECGSLIFYKKTSNFICFGCGRSCFTLEGFDNIIKIRPSLLNKIIGIYAKDCPS